MVFHILGPRMESKLLQAFYVTFSPPLPYTMVDELLALTWLHPSTWLSCLERGSAKNKLSKRECAGRAGARGRSSPLSQGDRLHSCPRLQNPAVPVRRLALPLSSSTLLARDLFVVVPPPSFLIPGPALACLAAKEKLQAFRKPHCRYPNRAPTEGTEQFVLEIAFLVAFFFSHCV